MFELTQQQSEDLVNIGIGKGFGISDIWSMGPSVALILMGKDAYNRLNQLVAGNFVFDSFYANASFFKNKIVLFISTSFKVRKNRCAKLLQLISIMATVK